MKLRPFVPATQEIPASEADHISGLPETVAYWTGGAAAGEWFQEVRELWGTPGLVVRRGPETVGYAVYAPAGHLPRALRSPAGPVGHDSVLLAYAAGDARTRKHLLVRVLKEMRLMGVGSVEAIGADAGLAPHHLPTRALLESGWEPVRRGRRGPLRYTLTRVELGSTVEVGELARGLIGRVRMPSFQPAPGTAPGCRGSFSRSRTASGNPAEEGYPEPRRRQTPSPA